MSTLDARPLWLGRSTSPPDALALELSATLDVDRPLARYDIEASQAHAAELQRLGLIDAHGASRLDTALQEADASIAAGTFDWRLEHEDVHMNVEAAVRDGAGPDLAGQLQAGRSRNEEVVTDERRWLLDAVRSLDELLIVLERTLVRRAAEEIDTVLPAHTHTQPAQPVLLAHHLLAYVEMLQRDRSRLADAATRANRSPAGSGAAAGSGLPLDRQAVAARLGFAAPTANSLDAVSDRDYAVELVAACGIGLNHISRLAGELVLWSTPYVGFVRLADGFTSGSSMLPNKRNPDSAELVRARAARLAGHVTTLLSLTRGLPLAYHRDFQETRGPMLDAVASYDLCLRVTDAMLASLTFNRAAMRAAATRGHSLATALAERLMAAGVPFREAHQRVARLVATADERGCDLAELSDDELRTALPELAERDPILPALDEALAAADVVGGTAPTRVRAAVEAAAERLGVPLAEAPA
ncbi:MAG: argininosuccinate lyase [Candidatus Limnocylindria bacterium]